MKTSQAYFLSLLSGILLAVCWNNITPSISLFFAFVPLLFIIQQKNIHYSQVFHYSFISFFLFNLGVSWWLCKASLFGGLSVIIINIIVQVIVAISAHKIRQKSNKIIGSIAFVLFWISFEYIQYHWEFSMPPMNLGNWLGQIPKAIQWYEYTGILGGSLWILVSNVLVYNIIVLYKSNRKNIAGIIAICEIIILILPAYISTNIYDKLEITGNKVKFAIIQPNINPYTEKYNTALFDQQIKRQIELAQSFDSIKKLCIIYPESSFPQYIDDNDIDSNKFVQTLKQKLISNNERTVVASCYTYKPTTGDTIYYNTSFMLNANTEAQVYNKSKLVIGVEKMPFDKYLKFLKTLNIDFGGYTTSLGTDNSRTVFSSSENSLKIAPVICYESVYGEFVTGFVKKGANCIAVMTNDAWWGNTPGYKQHLMHSQLRAIENRKEIVRATNTGTSCFINYKGEIFAQAEDWQERVLIGSISLNKYISFYTKYGDYIGWMSLIVSIILVFMNSRSFK